MLTPSEVEFSETLAQLDAGQAPINEVLAHLLSAQNLLPPSSVDDRPVLASTYLQNELQESEITSLKSSTSYLHFSDPTLPGPEYDIPRDVFLRAGPRERQSRRLWESWYEKFRDSRMEVCGLDLEPMPREAVKPPDALNADGR